MVIDPFSSKIHCSIIASKISAISRYHFPTIKKIVFFLIIFSKQYKKKLLLIYIIINLFFSNIIIVNTKIIEHYYFLKLSLKINFFFRFLSHFVTVYLPVLGSEQNFIKKLTTNKVSCHKQSVQRINYFNLPVIPELENLCNSNEAFSFIVNNTRLIIDTHICVLWYLKESQETLLRLFRLPYTVTSVK